MAFLSMVKNPVREHGASSMEKAGMPCSGERGMLAFSRQGKKLASFTGWAPTPSSAFATQPPPMDL